MRDPHGPMNAHEHPNSHDATRRRTGLSQTGRGDNLDPCAIEYRSRIALHVVRRSPHARVSVNRCFLSFFIDMGDIQHTRLYAREQGRPPTTVHTSTHDWTVAGRPGEPSGARRVDGDERNKRVP